MVPIAFLSTIGQMIVSSVADHFKRKQEIKAAEHEVKIKRIIEGDAHAAELDKISIAQRGWKDDYLLVLTTLPLALLFFTPILTVESLQDIPQTVLQGFQALEATPEYYWYALGLVYIDTFGFRRLFREAIARWLDSKFGGAQ